MVFPFQIDENSLPRSRCQAETMSLAKTGVVVRVKPE